MTRTIRIQRFRSWPLATLSGALLLVASCGKLVGIGDTEVTRNGNAGSNPGGADGAGAGTGGASSAGSPAAGSSTGGIGNHAGNSGADSGGSSAAGAGGAGTSGTGGVSGPAGTGTAGTAGAMGIAGSAGIAGHAGTAGTGGAASACPCSAPTPTCENNACVVRGPTMIQVTDSNYYIDSTEVTAKQYRAFQASNPATTGQRAGCAWNASFAPSDLNPDDDVPVLFVDFCDAAAYCTWADKRLCGAIGGGSLVGTDPDVDLNPVTVNATRSQWYLACSGPNGSEFCYGSTQSDTKCNETDGFGYGPDSIAASPVKFFSQCQGHYAGLYDMNGNALEWIDACDGNTGSQDHCAAIGGSWASRPDAGCNDYAFELRNTQAQALGFRCCSK